MVASLLDDEAAAYQAKQDAINTQKKALKEAEAKKNLLRTHTTAVSSRTLYKLAQLAKAVRSFSRRSAFMSCISA